MEAPPAIIAVTPLDGSTSLRIMPMDATVYLPTRSEFESLSRIVEVPAGRTLLMRYDIAHSGSNRPGRRLHSIISGSATQRVVGKDISDIQTFFLRNRY